MMTQKSTGEIKRNANGQMPKSVWSDGSERTLTMFTDRGSLNLRRKNYRKFSKFID